MARNDFPRRRGIQAEKVVSRITRYNQQKVWREKRRYMEKETERESQWKNHDRQEMGLKSMKGRVNEEFLPWLSRSLVCTTQEPRDVATLASAIVSGYGQCTKICALSGFQFILTF